MDTKGRSIDNIAMERFESDIEKWGQNNLTKKTDQIILLTIFNILFPVLGLFLNSVYYLFLQLTNKQKRIIFFNISFSMGFVGYLYFRTNDTGDVYRYGLSLYYYSESLLNGRENIISGVYELFYPTWYFVLYIANKLNLSIQVINFIAGFTIYSSFLYLILELQKEYKSLNADKMLFIKVFLFISFIVIFSGYKTLWAFSLVSIGLFFLMKNKKIGYIFMIIGGGLHPVAWVPVIIYVISKYFKFRIVYLYISLIMGILLKKFVFIFDQFLNIPFIGNKINTYIYGDWGQYRFHDNSEYINFFELVLLIIFIFCIIVFKFVNIKENVDRYFIKYNNFILWYFSISLWFVSFRTIELRLLLHGIIFFCPLFYQLFLNRKIYKKRLLSIILLLIWLMIIDFRIFNFWNDSYQIGLGFPLNLFSSPVYLFLKGAI